MKTLLFLVNGVYSFKNCSWCAPLAIRTHIIVGLTEKDGHEPSTLRPSLKYLCLLCSYPLISDWVGRSFFFPRSDDTFRTSEL